MDSRKGFLGVKTGNWTLYEAASALDAEIYGPDAGLRRTFRVDSRIVERGDAFVALPGEHVDGHDFIGQAISSGASVILARRDCLTPAVRAAADRGGVSMLLVDDTLSSLQELAVSRFASLELMHTIAITGTVGKTTTRDLVASCLSRSFKVHSAGKSFNTTIGCALTVLEAPVETEILVLEMGASHGGEISEMVSMFPPTIGVITEVGPGHLEGFGDVKGVLEAKMEMTESPLMEVLVYNGDNQMLCGAVDGLPSRIRRLPAGWAPGSCTIKQVETGIGEQGYLFCSVELLFEDDSTMKFDMPVFGKQHAYAAAFSASVCRLCGAPDAEIVGSMSSFSPRPGRGEVLRFGNGTVILDESYNSNPMSLSCALDNIGGTPWKGKKWAVLGGMGELGEMSTEWHKSVLKKTNCLNGLVLVGEEWREPAESAAVNRAILVSSAGEAARRLEALLESGDLVLIKGSRVYGLERVVAALGERR